MDKTKLNDILGDNLGANWENKRKTITDEVSAPSDKCCWCGQPIGPATFAAFSLDGKASICGECLGRYAVLSRLTKIQQVADKEKGDWLFLEQSILNEIAPEEPNEEAKMQVLNLIMRLARRAAGLLNGAKSKGDLIESKSGESLDAPRATVEWTSTQVAAFRRGLEFIGMPLVNCTKGEIVDGIAKSRLEQETMRDDMTFEYGVLYVRDGVVGCDLDCAVICAKE